MSLGIWPSPSPVGTLRCSAFFQSLKSAPYLAAIVDQLSRGRALSELAFAELPQEAKGPLAEAGVQEPWRRAANNGPWMTALLDLVEIAEIARLGRSEHSHPDPEAAHV